MKRTVFYLLALLLAAPWVFAACNDDNLLLEDEYTYIPQDSLKDVVGNKILHRVSLKNLLDSRLKLNTLSKLDITLPENCPIEFDVENDGVEQYLVPRLRSDASEQGLLVMPLRISPKGAPEKSRNLILIIWNDLEEKTTRASDDPFQSEYSEYLGRGTKRFKGLGSKEDVVISHEALKQLTKAERERYLEINTTLNTERMKEICGTSYEETMTEFGLNIGLSFSKVIQPKSQNLKSIVKNLDVNVKDENFFNGLFASLPPTRGLYGFLGGEGGVTVSTSLDFGLTGKTTASEKFEYFLNYYTYRKAELAINMSKFEYSANNPKPDTVLLGLLDEDFIRQICLTDSNRFSTTDFFETFGTDVITQAAFGGYYVTMYGRKENSYAHSLAIDVEAALKFSQSTEESSNLIRFYQLKNEGTPHIGGDVSVNHMNSEYQEVSQSFKYSERVGGVADEDPNEWAKAFGNLDRTDLWSLISYRFNEDRNEPDSISYVYPIETMALNMVYTYVGMVGDELSEGDLRMMMTAVANINALIRDKADYINANTTLPVSRTPMVVADFQMRRSDNNHKEDRLYRTDLTGPDGKRRLYRPLVVNKWAPDDEKAGGYLETSSDSYVAGVWDNTDQIWWVALDYIDECQPLKNICFMTPDEADSYSGYYDRGHRADGDMSYPTIDNHYVYVQNWNEGDSVDPITGIGIARRTNPSNDKRYYRVIASSPGTDMLEDYDNENRQKQFHYHWGEEYKYPADSIKAGKGGPYEIGIKGMSSSWDVDDHWFGHYWESSATQDNWLLPAISRKPLGRPLEYQEPKMW